MPNPGCSTPLVSIVTVCLNAASSIDDTIRSVALQVAEFGIEHVVVDGGSSDLTRDIIDHWAERRTNITRVYEPDKGIFDAMNKGFRAARGTFVMFLNADDFLISSGTLSDAMQGVEVNADSNPDMIIGDVVMGKLGSWGFWRHRRVPRLLGRLREIGFFPVHQGVLIKRTVLNQSGGFDSDMVLAADVTHFYDLEVGKRLIIRLLRRDVTYMRAGGASNSGIGAMYVGSKEIFQHLRKRRALLSAAAVVFVKTLQSLSEVRIGRCPHCRWFAAVGLSE